MTDTVYYDPYGTVISRTGATETPFLYVGQYGVESDQNGLYYMRARYYNPQIQRFINVDPIKDGYNWYGYVEGNPIIFTDPLGLEYIVISGGQYKLTKTEYKYEFIEPAIKNLRAFKARNDGETLTWIIANEGWTLDELNNIQAVAQDIGCNVVLIKNKEELFYYLNHKYDGSRYKDKIHAITVFAHGFNNKISLGYNYADTIYSEYLKHPIRNNKYKKYFEDYEYLNTDEKYNTDLDITVEDIMSKIYVTAFENPDSWFGACNLGNNTEDSFAQMWANRFKGRTWAFNGKSDYSQIITKSDKKELKARKKYGFSTIGSANYPIPDVDDNNATFHEFYNRWGP